MMTFALPPSRVLLVDDNRASAETLALLLELSGHDVRVAHDGLEAIATADDFRPAIALVDLTLPRLGGADVCRRLREHAWGRAMVIVTVTGCCRPDDLHQIDTAGFDGCLIKPIDYDALTSLLGRLIEGRASAPTL